ncbi:MAG: hypothetical protein H7A01_10495 [Hahellaceae bacterium]|jgi:response regulator of citrate/malate metabolism|nr:hypothetical protein [Hahellaceae bacterium]MCP5211091.1 hypothetical protein [Hahellaceae bacterium]
MINMIYMGLNLNDYVVERGKEKETKTIDVVNSGPALLKHEKESDLKYDAWVSSVKDQNKLSKTEFSSGGTNVDARKLRLNEAEKKGVAGISEATGFSRTTVHRFYALSVSSGIVNSMGAFVTKMIGEPTQSYGNIKNSLTTDEGAKILSTLV